MCDQTASDAYDLGIMTRQKNKNTLFYCKCFDKIEEYKERQQRCLRWVISEGMLKINSLGLDEFACLRCILDNVWFPFCSFIVVCINITDTWSTVLKIKWHLIKCKSKITAWAIYELPTDVSMLVFSIHNQAKDPHKKKRHTMNVPGIEKNIKMIKYQR